jgi:hypothetical protein
MKELRSTLVNAIIALTHAMFFWLPGGNAAHGAALAAFHPVFILSWVIIFFLYPSNRPLRLFICILACMTVFSHWYFRGCIVTRAEQQLTGSQDTTVDPLLHILRIKSTNETRLAITVGSSISITLIMLFSVCMDTLSV